MGANTDTEQQLVGICFKVDKNILEIKLDNVIITVVMYSWEPGIVTVRNAIQIP